MLERTDSASSKVSVSKLAVDLALSSLTSGLLALMFGFTVCYCAIQQIQPPEIVIYSMSSIITFFFTMRMANNGQDKKGECSK